jgi:NAD+ kinase
MSQPFRTLALLGKANSDEVSQTISTLYDFLTAQSYTVLVENKLSRQLLCTDSHCMDVVELGKNADLAIVVGGDGHMLGAARVLARYGVPVIGVNRGNLGFLTDLSPHDFQESLMQVLSGDYQTEHRFLLETTIFRHGEPKSSNTALNEAVLHPGKIAHMIDYSVYIDDSFVFSQRADGMIVSTPTGSTAYALSAGGPILTPQLNVMTLVPMFPHTLSCRPLVIDANRQVKLVISPDNLDEQLHVSCDGHVTLSVHPGDEIIIKRAPHELTLLHPKDYDYFNVLRSKLGWSNQLF